MRIRSIKPDFFSDEDLLDLEAANPGAYCMMVFAGLWGCCDKQGVFEWKPRSLKRDILFILPFDMAETLAVLEKAKFVRRFCVDGQEYGFVPTFKKHQRITGKEGQEPAKYPAPPVLVSDGNDGSNENNGNNEQVEEKNSGDTNGTQTGHTGATVGMTGREGKGREEERKKSLQGAGGREPVSGDEDLTENQLRVVEALERHGPFLREHYPLVDFGLETRRLLEKARASPILDAGQFVLAWFPKAKAGGVVVADVEAHNERAEADFLETLKGVASG